MKHFTIDELTHSDTAIGHGIANNPGAVERENLRRLAERVAHIICRGAPPTSTPAAAATPN